MTHIFVSKLTIIGSDNGLSPDRRQAIIWTNAGLLLIEHLGTNFSEILIEVLTFSFSKMRLKVSSAKRRPFCLGLNGLKAQVMRASLENFSSRGFIKSPVTTLIVKSAQSALPQINPHEVVGIGIIALADFDEEYIFFSTLIRLFGKC